MVALRTQTNVFGQYTDNSQMTIVDVIVIVWDKTSLYISLI